MFLGGGSKFNLIIEVGDSTNVNHTFGEFNMHVSAILYKIICWRYKIYSGGGHICLL